jgi:hypothetical protein
MNTYTTTQVGSLTEISFEEIEAIGGAVNQSTAIGFNTAVAPGNFALAPAGVPAAIIFTSVATTASYFYDRY